MVWLKDPFAALEPNLSDFLMTVDSTNSTDDSPAQKPCAGLIFARATEPTRYRDWKLEAISQSPVKTLALQRKCVLLLQWCHVLGVLDCDVFLAGRW